MSKEKNLIDQVFLRYYEIPSDFEQEPQIAAIKIVGVYERNRDGDVTIYETLALRDDKRPKRVGDKVRTISVDALAANWVTAPKDVALSDKQVYENGLAAARDFLVTSVDISPSQASAIVSIIADMTASADKRKISRAKTLIEKAQSGASASLIGMVSLIAR